MSACIILTIYTKVPWNNCLIDPSHIITKLLGLLSSNIQLWCTFYLSSGSKHHCHLNSKWWINNFLLACKTYMLVKDGNTNLLPLSMLKIESLQKKQKLLCVSFSNQQLFIFPKYGTSLAPALQQVLPKSRTRRIFHLSVETYVTLKCNMKKNPH